MSYTIKLVALFFLILLALVVSTMSLHRRAIVEDINAPHRLITRTQFQCPDGTTDTIEGWGKAGYMRFCKNGGVNDGPWMA